MQNFCIRSTLALVAAVLYAQDPAGVPAPPSPPATGAQTENLPSRVEAGKIPVAGAIQRLQELAPAVEPDPDGAKFEAVSDLFCAACRKASPDELHELATLLTKFPGDSDDFLACFGAYTSNALRHEVAKLKAKPHKLEVKGVPGPTPEYLKKSPKELISAWTAWRALMEPAHKLKKAAWDAEEAGTIRRPKQLEPVLRKLLPTPADGLWKELVLYDYTEGIFTGSDEEHYHLRNRAAVLSLLHEGKMEEAIALACAELADTWNDDWQSPQTYPATLIDFLTALGVDWEPIFVGALLGAEDEDRDRHLILTDRNWSEAPAWNALGALGSPRGIRLGLTMLGAMERSPGEMMTFLTHAAGPPPKTWTPEYRPSRRLPQRTTALPAKLRAQIIAELSAQFQGKVPADRLESLLEDLPGWLVKDLRKPLTRILKNPNHRIAAIALDLLSEAGLADPKTAIAPPPQPIRVRLLLDGKPLSGAQVHVSTDAGMQSGVEVDAEGRLTYPIDDVLEPAKMEKIGILLTPKNWGRTPESDPTIKPGQKPDPKIWPGPCVEYRVDVKAAQQREVELNVETGELEIGLEGGDGIPKDSEIKVSLERADREEGSVDIERKMEATGQPGTSVLFQRLQAGKYDLQIEGDGIARITPIQVRTTKAGTTKLIKLVAARNVRAEFEMPDGKKAPLGAALSGFGEFTRDGGKFEWNQLPDEEDQELQGLPLGKYRLRLPGYSEIAAKMKADGDTVPDVPPNQRFAPLVIEFELKADSPPVLDLGTIKLKLEEPKDEPKKNP